MASRPPWKRPDPKKRPATKLTPEFQRLARARARRAGRPYPNLVDNMYAAQQQRLSGDAPARKPTAKPARKRTVKSRSR